MAARIKKADAVSMALVIAPSIPYMAKLRSVDMIGIIHEQASNWGVVVLIAGGVLLSPIFGFLIALVVDILIGLLKDSGVPALLTLVVAGVIGGFLFRTMLPPPVESLLSRDVRRPAASPTRSRRARFRSGRGTPAAPPTIQ
jgi:hypothetical protein